MNHFCAYQHCKPDGTPFYVGKGTLKRARHLNRKHHNPYHVNIVKKYGIENICVEIIASDLSEEDAFFFEVEAIDIYRRRGIELANLTDGGEGSSGWKASDATRQKMRETRVGMKGRPHTLETKLRLSELAKMRDHPMHSEETKAKIRSSHKGKKFSESHLANLRSAAAIRNKSQQSRERNRLSHTGKKFSEEAKAKSSESHKGILHTPETKAKISAARKLYWANKKRSIE